MSQLDVEPIAIVGSGCRFPGAGNTTSRLWDLLCHPVDLLSPIPPERFDSGNFYHPDPLHHGTSNIKHSYVLEDDVRKFDAQFFGVKPVEANAMDPQQRILLETVYESLESGGLTIESLKGSNTAVYVGIMCGDYETMLLRDVDDIPRYHATGIARSLASNRVSYFFNWHGPCMTIDTACSSSLVAVHEAVQALRSGRSKVAIAAGSNLLLEPENYISQSKLKMLSPDGRSRMWDAGANGYARGEGVAAVVLKTLRDALADGDHVECVIRNTGINQDGRTPGITMPSATAQAALIHSVYREIGMDPMIDRPQYFEAHGTGTPAGDPIEARAICSAFFKYGPLSPDAKLYVGSIKTLVGHTEGTAGLAGLIKTAMCLKHGMIVPNLLFSRLNPEIKPFYDSLEIPTVLREWPQIPDGQPRRASVNSFGFGGTNAHAILESHEQGAVGGKSVEYRIYIPFVLSAASNRALVSGARALSEHLKANPSTNLQDLAWTLFSRRTVLPLRVTFSASTIDSLSSELDKFAEAPSGTAVGGAGAVGVEDATSASILGIFTGQGAQWCGMGRELIESSPFCRNIIQKLEDRLYALPDRPAWSLREELVADASASRINEAELSQPLCTAVQILLVDLLHVAGASFTAVVGHSSGEIGAAYAAGAISAEDAICIAYYRGHHAKLAVGSGGRRGAMMAVECSIEYAKQFCASPPFEGRICIAASNSSSSTTLSGDEDAIIEAQAIFHGQQKFARILKVDRAYHSHHMIPCWKPYVDSLRSCDIRIRDHLRSSWFSSVHRGDFEQHKHQLTDIYWAHNMQSPVLFSQAIEQAFEKKGPFDITIEIGPHPTLKSPATQTIRELGGQTSYVGTLSRNKDSILTLSNCLGHLWARLGAMVDLQAYSEQLTGENSRTLLKDLPAYCWDHDQVYWHESQASHILRTTARTPHELLGRQCPDGTSELVRWRNVLCPREVPWLYGHQLQGQIVFPAAGYIVMAFESIIQLAANQADELQLIEVSDMIIRQALVFTTEDDIGVKTQFSLATITNIGSEITASFSFFSTVGGNSESMALIAEGKVKAVIGSAIEEALPSNSSDEVNMGNVDAEQFYSFLDDTGYGYSGPFRSVSNLRRKCGVARGDVARLAQGAEQEQYIVHPATLDSAFQSVFLAYSYPYDGKLWSIHVPKTVHRVRLNPRLWLFQDEDQVMLPVEAVLEEGLGIGGDVSIYSDRGYHGMLQVDGIRCVPFSAATSADDRKIFANLAWETCEPDGNAVAWDGSATDAEYELARIAERVSLFYLRLLDDEIPQDHHARFGGPYAGMFDFAADVLARTEAGLHPHTEKVWKNDTFDDIRKMGEKFPDSLDLQMIHTVGHNIRNVVRGNSTLLEHMMSNDLLNRYYEGALGFPVYTRYLARMVAQLSHKNPHMSILEIGAGTGGATKSIIKEIGGTFSSYTYSDVSTGFFPTAQEVFKDHTGKMRFRALDIDRSPTDQGFQDHSFDLVVASLVIHATKDMEEALRNVRRLLRPGGYLLMLEVKDKEPIRVGTIFGALPGWWSRDDDGHLVSPCIPADRWDFLLRTTGFGGIDAITPDPDTLPYPVSLMAAQAVDERMNLLRSPLSVTHNSLSDKPPIQDLLIIGGASRRTSRLIERIATTLENQCHRVRVIKNLESTASTDLSSTTTILSLSDVDKPVFKDLSLPKFKALKLIFEEAKTILWVTADCRASDPYANCTVGFGRTVMLETAGLSLQFLDLDASNDVDPTCLAEILLRFNIATAWERKGSYDASFQVEPELALKSGKVLIPRLKANSSQNLRCNSSRRGIYEMVEHKSFPVSIEEHGKSLSMSKKSTVCEQGICDAKDRVTVHVSRSILASLNLASDQSLYLVLGTNISTGEPTAAFSTIHASIIRIPKAWSVSYPVPAEAMTEGIAALEAHLLAVCTIGKMKKSNCLLVHNPNPLFADALIHHASERGVQLVLATSRSPPQNKSWTRIHPYSTDRSIRNLIPQRFTVFLDLSSEQDSVGSRLSSMLPTNCVRMTTSTLFGALVEPSITPLNSVLHHLQTAASSSLDQVSTVMPLEHDEISLIHVSDYNRHRSPWSVVNWSSSNTARVKIQPAESEIRFANDKTYWLVGLTGSLGISLCEWMIRRGARYVILSSRNPEIDKRWLEQMRALGGMVQVFACDVTSRDDLQGIAQGIRSALPPLAGVVQGAALLEDTALRNMTYEKMIKVLRPKIDGSVHLDSLFSNVALDFFIFLSSTTMVLGNIGQANYTAANAFMSTLAAQRRAKGLAASVLNLGPVLGVGYVDRAVGSAGTELLRRGGYIFLSEWNFHQLFAEAVLASPPDSGRDPEITASPRHVSADDTYKPIWSGSPKFRHLVTQASTSDIASGSSVDAPVKTRLLGCDSVSEAYDIIKAAFIARLKSLLQLRSEEQSSSLMGRRTDSLGVDSLIAVEIRSWLLKTLDVSLPVLKILGGVTIRDLVDHVVKHLSPHLIPKVVAREDGPI